MRICFFGLQIFDIKSAGSGVATLTNKSAQNK